MRENPHAVIQAVKFFYSNSQKRYKTLAANDKITNETMAIQNVTVNQGNFNIYLYLLLMLIIPK